MSSPPNGRYKSKLFNFLSRKSRQLKDESDRAVRNLKVAAVWGAQILLYPVYLLAQTSQLAGRQLQQATQEKFPQLHSGKKDRTKRPNSPPTPPPTDAPIQEVLRAIAGQEESEFALNPSANSVAAASNKAGIFSQVADAINRVSTTYFGFQFFDRSAAGGSSHSISSNLTLPPLNLPETVVVQTLQPKAAAGTSNGQSLAAALRNQIVVRGVATQLATRSVVLVTADNQILDILTPEQQQKLQQRIRWELANYWRQWRLVQASAKGIAAQLRPPVNQRHLLPPVRLFWGVIAWVQQGPVAIAANLFQESTLVQGQETTGEAEIGRRLSASREEIGTIPHPSSSLLLQPLIFLDRTMVAIEVRQKDFLAKLTPRSGEMEVVARSPLQRIQAVFSQPMRQPASPDVTDAQAPNIQALIQAAIDYFFGRRNGKLPWESTPEIDSDSYSQTNRISGGASASLASAQRKNPALSATGVADPWLTMNDLFGQPDAPTSKQPTRTAPHRPLPRVAGKAQPSAHLPGKKTRTALPGANQPDMPAENSVWKSIKLRLSFKQTILTPRKPTAPEPMAARPTPTPSTTKKSRKKDGKITKAPTFQTPRVEAEGTLSNLSPAIAQSNRTSFATHSPDWIEAEVTPAGYVKHPLEYLLEWLDKAMLWLENFFVKVWHWVKKF
ncbi:hypothetical protein [Coleofasciculus sp. FACHB-1120]|uniref:hypothetical protein n=1 Tax=Coleofasciculus sp. FACHB-1120 TaxID=2692783 RepID=UPI0016820C00|nr:hypothetical protein [Coleofasciculus sp. FACHB-1120]MBD2744080.1 hypothetical protein [Coleofasciculus sp. FACHB-1120]